MFEPRDIHRGFGTSSRFRFQLASLVDLLLILVFAQLLEVREATELAARQSQQALAAQAAEMQQSLELAKADLDTERQRLEEMSTQLRDQRDAADAIADAAGRERDQVLETVVDLLTQSSSSFSPSQSSESARATVASAEQLARQLGDLEPAELLRFLVGYNELLKRAEVWTVHVSDRGDISVSQPGTERSFRLEARTQTARTQEFTEQLVVAVRTFPQPKGLVVLLGSYSPRAVAGNYQPLIDGLPRAVEVLNADQGIDTRFESAVLGAVRDAERDLSGDLRPTQPLP